jgi:sulfide dehydrogenase cytochrome subunit
MKHNFYKTLNTTARRLLLALFAGGLTLLSYAASESSAKVPLTFTAMAPATSPTPTDKGVISGELMAHSCAGCHGTLGRLGDESFMPLAGMPLNQFVSSMLAFRDGKRPATLMGHVAQGFSDAEIRAMGEFFASVKPEGKRP